MGTRLRQPGGGVGEMSELVEQDKKTALKKTRVQSVCLSGEPQLCRECHGAGAIIDGFMGFPMFCPECGGDGIARP